MLYPLVRSLSLLIRVYLCYITIDNIPIIENPLLNEIFLEVFSMYWLLWFFTYFTNRKIINALDITSSTTRALIYFVIYCIYLFVLYGILVLLTNIKILPI